MPPLPVSAASSHEFRVACASKSSVAFFSGLLLTPCAYISFTCLFFLYRLFSSACSCLCRFLFGSSLLLPLPTGALHLLCVLLSPCPRPPSSAAHLFISCCRGHSSTLFLQRAVTISTAMPPGALLILLLSRSSALRTLLFVPILLRAASLSALQTG